jgi:hypothetical protein
VSSENPGVTIGSDGTPEVGHSSSPARLLAWVRGDGVCRPNVVPLGVTQVGLSPRRHRLGLMEDLLGVQRDERATLGGFLDWYRAVVERKITGLSHEQATTVMTPSGVCPLGVVKHLGWVERGWFRETFSGEEIEMISVGWDNSPEFRADPEDTVESVLTFYRAEAEHARGLVAATPSLDALSARAADFRGHVSLRWIMVHMLEETARHAGHLDLMRERIDGQTGD